MDPRVAYLVLLLAVLLYWNWRFIGLDRLTGLGRARHKCRWRKQADATEDAPAHWVCDRCAAEVGTRDGREPARCMAGQARRRR